MLLAGVLVTNTVLTTFNIGPGASLASPARSASQAAKKRSMLLWWKKKMGSLGDVQPSQKSPAAPRRPPSLAHASPQCWQPARLPCELSVRHTTARAGPSTTVAGPLLRCHTPHKDQVARCPGRRGLVSRKSFPAAVMPGAMRRRFARRAELQATSPV